MCVFPCRPYFFITSTMGPGTQSLRITTKLVLEDRGSAGQEGDPWKEPGERTRRPGGGSGD